MPHVCTRLNADALTASRIFMASYFALVLSFMEVTFLFNISPSLSRPLPLTKLSGRLERGSRPRKRDEGEGLHFRRNVVLELESE